MARKKFACDFETTTDPKDCRVWAYGVMEIGNQSNYHIDNSIDKFMEWAKKVKADLYFHNLRFDGSFIVNWLLTNGWEHSTNGEPNTFEVTISNQGQWYKITICYGYKGKRKLHTTIYDSLKKLPFTIDRIGKAFKLDVNKIDVPQEFYERYRAVDHEITEEEYEYILHDIKVLASALEIQFSQGLTRMTIGGDSLNGFKQVISSKQYDRLFPKVSLALDKELRMAYRGGFTWLNKKYKNVDLGKGIVFDVNSLYPYIMYDKLLPYGTPIPYNGKYTYDEEYPLYIQHIRCSFVTKEDKIPTIQIKNKEQRLLFPFNEYLESSKEEIVDLYVTNVDLQLIEDHYELYDLEYINGWKFKGVKGLFKGFIDYWGHVKETNEGAIRELAKLMLNNLYGKFATNPDMTGRIPELEEGVLKFKEGEEEFKDPEYTPMGVFITSYARDMTIRTAQVCYDRIIYCDTDSIHLVGTEIPKQLEGRIDSKKLGYWDHETTFQKARYIKQKTYCQCVYQKDSGKRDEDGNVIWVQATGEDYDRTKFKVTGAGMNDKVKAQATWENFKVGFSAWGNLKGRQVKGGMVLIDSEFTLKDR